MPTEKKRLNITLPKEVDMLLHRTARRDMVPVATKALHLLMIALEAEEDTYWNNIAYHRDTKHASFVSHSSAWI